MPLQTDKSSDGQGNVVTLFNCFSSLAAFNVALLFQTLMILLNLHCQLLALFDLSIIKSLLVGHKVSDGVLFVVAFQYRAVDVDPSITAHVSLHAGF